MNLNQYDRSAFVKAVMDDVPSVDYKQRALDMTIAAVLKLLPKEVRAVYKLCPEYLDKNSPNTPGGLDEPYMPTPRTESGSSDYNCISKRDPETWAKLEELAELNKAQHNQRDALENKLIAVIGACRTLKQAQERLPEFAKYLPAERGTTGVSNLPVANVIADLTAAGWPKGNAKAPDA